MSIDIEGLFYEYKTEKCIPILDMILIRFPMLKVKLNIILTNALRSADFELVKYVFDKNPHINLFKEDLLIYNLMFVTPEIAKFILNNLNVQTLQKLTQDKKKLNSFTLFMYYVNNVNLIEYIKNDQPALLEYDYDLVKLFMLCLYNESFDSAQILQKDFEINVKDIFIDLFLTRTYNYIQTNWDIYTFHHRIDKRDADINIIGPILVSLFNLDINEDILDKIINHDAYISTEKLFWLFDHTSDENKQEKITTYFYKYYSGKGAIRGISTVEYMIKFAEKYDIKIKEDLLRAYIDENRFVEKNHKLLLEFAEKYDIKIKKDLLIECIIEKNRKLALKYQQRLK